MDALKADIAELKRLEASTTRDSVRAILTSQRTKMECNLIEMEEKEMDAQNPDLEKPKAPTQPQKSFAGPRTIQIRTYAWEQTAKVVKIHVSEGLKGVQDLPQENISASFAENSFRLHVHDLNGSHYELHMIGLFGALVPEQSSFKVRTDRVLVSMQKKSSGDWPALTRSEAQLKEKKKPSSKLKDDNTDSSDPSAGLMKLMQQMYEDGDDEMKRTIAKAWHESREKQNQGMM